MIKIVATISHFLKAKMHQIRFQLRLRPRLRWGSSQRAPKPLSWILGVLLLRKGRGEEEGKRQEKGGRE